MSVYTVYADQNEQSVGTVNGVQVTSPQFLKLVTVRGVSASCLS